MLTSEILHGLWPDGDMHQPGLMDATAAAAADVFGRYGLDTDLLIAHAMAQFTVECGGGRELEENLNYSAEGLLKTWPSRFTPQTAADYAGQPEKIANFVYGGRKDLGNRPGTNDGWDFRGRGGSQLTGRENYEKLGDKLGLDLLGNPDLVNDPAHFLECAVADFVQCGCLPWAKQDNVDKVSEALNGGDIGLEDRRKALTVWRSVMAGEGMAWLQYALNRLGAKPRLTVDGDFGQRSIAAWKAFLGQQGLPQTNSVTAEGLAAVKSALAAQGG